MNYTTKRKTYITPSVIKQTGNSNQTGNPATSDMILDQLN
jgi:hypothetical protein